MESCRRAMACWGIFCLVAIGRFDHSQAAVQPESEAGIFGPESQSVWQIDARRSLFVTEQPILARFGFRRVMDQLVRRSRVPGLTAKQLFNQWWDTQNPKPSLGLGRNCDTYTDAVGQPSINGFPYVCRPASERQEGQEAFNDPFVDAETNPGFYFPIALANRFDVAPANGANCGGYRIVYARRSGLAFVRNRNLLIFESVLPNPNPKLGLQGCRMIVRFWANLSTQADIERRADLLERFYFYGIGGLPPAVDISNYGANPQGRGQVRTNQFLEQKAFDEGRPRFWILREYKLQRQCHQDSCSKLEFVPVTVKDNSYGGLFSPASTDPRAPAFQRFFLKQIPMLAADTLAGISMGSVPDEFNAAQSVSLNPLVDDYVAQLGSGPSAFRSAIEAKLVALGSTLTADNVVARAMALSCAGCHQLSANMDVGGGLVWPASTPSAEPNTPQGFVHTTERFTETVDGVKRFLISPALTDVFLPARKQIMEEFLGNRQQIYRNPDDPIGGRRVH